MLKIIIPAYNEENNIERCITDVYKLLKSAKIKVQFYIVNDGSKDNTLEILKKLSSKFPIRITNHPKNKGVAEAFKSGFKIVSREAEYTDVIILMEGDCTSDHRLAPKMFRMIRRGVDVVIASRFVGHGKYKNFPLYRTVLSLSVNYVLRLLFRLKGVKDYTIFYRAYKAEFVIKMVKDYKDKFITSKSYVANAEVLINLSRYTRNFREIPFVYDYGKKKGPSGMKIFRNISSYLDFLYSKLILSRA